MKRRFRVEDNKVLRASWEDDEDRTEIYLERKWKEMMNRACEIPAPEDNGGLPHHLVVVVPQKKGYC